MTSPALPRLPGTRYVVPLREGGSLPGVIDVAREVGARQLAHRGDLLSLTAGDLAANVIGHAVARGLDQPGARVGRQPVSGPMHGAGEQGFLHGVFGRSEVAESPSGRAENLRRKFAQQTLDARLGRHES